MRPPTCLLLLLLLALPLAGCGHKGPLYLPAPDRQPQPKQEG